MRYTQKDMRERLGFSRDTLRFYEKRGLISPEVDPDNGYRYYDDWQINLLWDAKHYQGMGFSLDEVQQILQQDSLGALRDRLVGRTEELAWELRVKRLVLEETEHQLALMGEVEGLLGSYRIVRHEGCLFVARRHDLELGGHITPAIEFSNRYVGLMAPYFWFPHLPEGTGPTSDGTHYYWGYAMRLSTYRDLDRPMGEGHVVHLEPCQALVTCVDAGERGSFGPGLFAGLIAEAERRGLSTAGTVHGVLVARVHEGEAYHRYLRAYLPLAG